MKKQVRVLMVLMLLVALLAFPTIAFAHQTVTVGDYNVEYGWVNEPAVVGQPNAVVINITPKDFAASGGAPMPPRPGRVCLHDHGHLWRPDQNAHLAAPG